MNYLVVVKFFVRGYEEPFFDASWLQSDAPVQTCDKAGIDGHVFAMPVSYNTMCQGEHTRFLDFVPTRG